MNIDDENDCMNCGQCHDCIVLTMETAHEAEVAELRAEIAAKDAEIERLNELFDLRHKADSRAILQWRASGEGRDMVSPDHADLVCHLAEKLEFANHFTTMLQEDSKTKDAEIERLRAENETVRQHLRKVILCG